MEIWIAHFDSKTHKEIFKNKELHQWIFVYGFV